MYIKQAVVLVGGRGTRLGMLVNDIPKPLMQLGNSSFLHLLVHELSRLQLQQIILLCGYHADIIVKQFHYKKINNTHIICISESQPMGTAGALTVAADLLDEQFLLLNGDSFFDINLFDLITVAKNTEWIGKVALHPLAETGRFGVVTLENAQISSFAEKKGSGQGLINAGIYLLQKSILNGINNIPCSLEKDIFPKLVRQGLLYGRSYEGYFIDIGIPEDLTRAQAELPQRTRPTLFFDRDGVLNHDHGYVHRSENFHWTTGAIEAIKYLNDYGWLVIVVTNQAGIARGYYDEPTMHKLHQWMQQQLQLQGAHIDAFYHCPHHPEGVVAELTIHCNCRKPNPGMLQNALQEWPIDLNRSLLIGDKESDMQAAKAVKMQAKKFSGEGLHAIVLKFMQENS